MSSVVSADAHYRWISVENDFGVSFLEIIRECWDQVGVMIHTSQTYVPVGLSSVQALELADALEAGVDFVVTVPSRYKTSSVSLTVSYDVGEVFFLARVKDSVMGNVVAADQIDDIVNVLRFGAAVTDAYLAAKNVE